MYHERHLNWNIENKYRYKLIISINIGNKREMKRKKKTRIYFPCIFAFFLSSIAYGSSFITVRRSTPDTRFPISESAYLRATEIANDPTTIQFYPNSLRKISIDVIRAFIISFVSSVRIRLLPSLRFQYLSRFRSFPFSPLSRLRFR